MLFWKKSILFLCFIFFGIFSFAQNYMDSLSILFSQSERDSLFFERLYDYSQRTYNVAPDTTLYYLEQADIRTEDTSLYRGIGLCQLIRGFIFKHKGDGVSAINAYKKALELFQSIDYDTGIASTYNNLGVMYKRMGLYKKALEFSLKSLELKKEVGDRERLMPIYTNLGILHYRLGEYGEAMDYYHINEQLCKEFKDTNRLMKLYVNMGNIKLSQKNFSEAYRYYQNANDFLEPNTNFFLKSTILVNIGITYDEKEEYEKAQTYYQEAFDLANRVGNYSAKIISLIGLGQVHFELNNDKRGLDYTMQAYGLAKQNRDLNKIASISNKLYVFYKEQGDFQNSLSYLEVFHRYNDSIKSMEKTKEIERLKAQYENKQKEQQISLLEKENKVQELELAKEREARAKRKWQIFVLIGVVVVVAGLSLYFAFLNRQKKRMNKILREQYSKIQDQQEEITSQNDKLASANELKDQMFKIIAHDLRSPLIAMDDVARLIPYAIEEKDFESLQDLSFSLQNSVARILDLTDNLLSWSMSQSDEISYKPDYLQLHDIGNRTLEVYNALARMKKIDLINDIDPNLKVFADPNILMTVLRNLVNNALKFTRDGGMVAIGATMTKSEVRVWVQDTGIGMEKAMLDTIFQIDKTRTSGTRGESGNGLGLFFCKKFVHINKGEIHIESQKGEGTIVSFTVPRAKDMIYSG